MRIIITIFLLFCSFNLFAQYPKPLPFKGSKLSLDQIRTWMIKHGEIKDTSKILNLKALIALSHLENKSHHFSIAAFYGYAIPTTPGFEKRPFNTLACTSKSSDFIYLKNSNQKFYTDSTLNMVANHNYIVFSDDHTYGKVVDGRFILDGICPIDLNSNMSAQKDVSMISAYPNPFVQQTTVEFSLPEYAKWVTFEFFNGFGKKEKLIYKGEALSGQKYSFPLDGSGYKRGLYFLRLETSTGKAYTFKLFKNTL